jgi:tetratricopeptide (TPR) repeat protein
MFRIRQSFRIACALVPIAFLAWTAVAQQSGQQSSPPSSGSTSTGTAGAGSTGSAGSRPTPTPTPTPSPTDRQTGQRDIFQDYQRPIFISGKVMMDDGTPPPDSVVIQRVCNGNPRPEGYTDSKGRFSFQLGDNRAMIADASVGSSASDGFGTFGSNTGSRSTLGSSGSPGSGSNRSVTERDLMGCELRAYLPGFRSDVVNLAGRRLFDNPEVGTIILHRMGNVEGTTISFTSLQAPKDAKKSYEKAREALKKNKTADAEKELEKAVAGYPKYATAWFELGQIRQSRNDVEGARKAYQESLAADSRYVSPYIQLAWLASQEKKWQEVSETCDRVIRLNPLEFPQAYFFNAVANYNLGKIEAAEKNAREAQKIDPQHRFPKVDHLLGVILAERRDYSGALGQMRAYLQFAPAAKDADLVRKQIGELERLTGAAAAAKANQ